ncbi:MAG TPA: hypothetical protein VFF11_04325, partial [Candidatus Binatia bacterium]|nr:hypothetical protein [Candidatus Binatia bacterium]
PVEIVTPIRHDLRQLNFQFANFRKAEDCRPVEGRRHAGFGGCAGRRICRGGKKLFSVEVEIGGQPGGKGVVFWFFLFCLKKFEQADECGRLMIRKI